MIRGLTLPIVVSLAVGIQPVIVSTSPIKIGCFVARDQVEQAVQALHAAFELERPEAERRHA